MSWNGLGKNILNLTFFLHTKTLIAPVKLKSDSSVLSSAYSLISPSMVVQKVRNKTPHMGFNVLEWFALES